MTASRLYENEQQRCDNWVALVKQNEDLKTQVIELQKANGVAKKALLCAIQTLEAIK